MSDIGITDRDDLREAVHHATARRKAWLAKAAIARQLEAELTEALKASTSLSPPASRRKERPRKTPRFRRDPTTSKGRG